MIKLDDSQAWNDNTLDGTVIERGNVFSTSLTSGRLSIDRETLDQLTKKAD